MSRRCLPKWTIAAVVTAGAVPGVAGAAVTPPTYAGQYTSFAAQPTSGYNGPEGVSIDGGNVLVADTANNQVEELSSAGSTVAGPFGSTFLNRPRQAVALDSEWIVSDSYSLERVDRTSGSDLGTFAAIPNGTLVRGVAINGQGNEVAVANTGSNEVDVYSVTNQLTGTLALQLKAAGGIALNGPESVAFTAAGDILVGDNGNHRLVEFDGAGGVVRVIGSPQSLISAMEPTGVTVDQGTGNIWVSDFANSQLEEFDASGTLLQTVVNGGSSPLSSPVTDALDPASGDLYLADTGHNRVVRYSGAGSTATTTTTTTSTTSSSSTSSMSVAFTIHNPSGTPQFAYYIVEPTGHAAPVASDWGTASSTVSPGSATLNVTPGETVYFNRTSNVSHSSPTGTLTPPEGVTGQGYPVSSATPSTVTVTLPSAGATYNAGLSAAERWVIGQLNQRRVAAGHQPLLISSTLDAAASVEARDEAVNRRWPDPYVYAIPQDQGWPGDIWNDFTQADAPFSDPQRVLTHWDGDPSDAESGNIWNALNDPNLKYVGIADGDGAWIIQGTYACPSTSDSAACGLTNDQGDPNAWSPPAGSAPAASTMQPNQISSTEITLYGTIGSTSGLDTHYYFQYGPDLDHMPNDIPAAPGRDIGTGAPYSALEDLTGLAPNTNVCYRLVASNSAGTTYAHDDGSGTPGTNRGICTQTSGPPIAPRVFTGAASPFADSSHPTGTAEELGGTVNPENQPTKFMFQYSVHSDLAGAGDHLSPSVAGEIPTHDPGADVSSTGTSPVTVGALTTGLKPGTRYFYRLVATNAAGITYDSAVSFVSDTGRLTINGGLEDADGNAVSGHVAENSGLRFFWYCSTQAALEPGVADCSASGAVSGDGQSRAVAVNTGEPGTYTVVVAGGTTSGATASRSFTYVVDAPPAPAKVQQSDQQNTVSSTYAVEQQAAAAGLCRFVYDGGTQAGVYCPSTLSGLGGWLYAAPGYETVSGPMKVGSGNSLISDKGLGVIAAGAGNVIAAGAGNVIAAGSGNVIAAGSGNVVALVKASVIAAGSGNVINAGAYNLIAGNEASVIAAGAGNVIAAGAGNVIAAGAGNVIAAGAGNLIDLVGLAGSSFGPASNAIAAITSVSSLIPGNLNSLISTNQASVIAAGAGNVINAGAYNAPNEPLADAARVTRSHTRVKTLSLATGEVTFTHGGQKLGMLIVYTAAGKKVIAAIRAANLKRLAHRQHHLLSLRLTLTDTFTPKGRGKTVTVSKTFTVTPVKNGPAKSKKKR